mmetsp:Transcript_87460/g.220083  ORF Transcript_87460/g.220083 Transcript_87460/m.220083 type:complete len:206 (-) Transcript_87460:582-1199(-)
MTLGATSSTSAKCCLNRLPRFPRRKCFRATVVNCCKMPKVTEAREVDAMTRANKGWHPASSSARIADVDGAELRNSERRATMACLPASISDWIAISDKQMLATWTAMYLMARTPPALVRGDVRCPWPLLSCNSLCKPSNVGLGKRVNQAAQETGPVCSNAVRSMSKSYACGSCHPSQDSANSARTPLPTNSLSYRRLDSGSLKVS